MKPPFNMLSSRFRIYPTFSFCRHETLACRNKFQVQGDLEVLNKSWQQPSTAHRVFCTSAFVPPSEPSDAKAPGVASRGSGSALAPGQITAASTASGAMSERVLLANRYGYGLPGSCVHHPSSKPGDLRGPIDDGSDGLAGDDGVAAGDWERMGAYLAAYDETREGVIKRCRDVQKLAKQAVYSLHRGDMQGAAKQLAKAEAVAAEISPSIAKYPALRSGSFAAAVEEYVEARAFACFLEEGRLIRSDELPLAEPEEFLGGVLDFTGELNRYAIARATVRDSAAVQLCRDLVDALMGRFLQFDLRNGSLRKKYDSLKYTLKKMEGTLYELALTEGMGLKISSEAAMGEPPTGAGEVERGEEEDM